MTDRETVLIIGHRREMVQAAERLGLKSVTVCNADTPEWEVPSGALSTLIPVETLGDIDDYVRAVHRAGFARFDAVVTPAEASVVQAALVGNAMAGSGLPVGTAVAFRDKFVQKRTLKGALPVARMEIVEDGTLFDGHTELRLPVVVKPVNGAGAHTTAIASDRNELREAVAAIVGPGEPRAVLLEEYVPGEELHIDGYVLDGIVRNVNVSSYGAPLLSLKSGRVASSISTSREHDPQLYDSGVAMAQTVVDVLGLDKSLFHLEAFWDGSTLAFGECGARAPGSYIAPQYRAMRGIDLYEAQLLLALGRGATIAGHPRGEGVAGWTYLPSTIGVPVNLPSAVELREAGIEEFVYSIADGDPAPDTRISTSTMVGQALVTAPTIPALRRRLKEVAQWFWTAAGNDGSPPPLTADVSLAWHG